MNILVIGNGFDLAHELPTKYGDFLEMIQCFKSITNEPNIMRSGGLDNIEKPIYAFLDRFIFEENTLSAEFNKLIEDNFWIEYFLQCLMYQKENWIDFEKEISNVIKDLVERRNYCLTKEPFKSDYFEYLNELCKIINNLLIANSELTYKNLMECLVSTINKDQIDDILSVLLKDLNRLTRALDIYISYFIGDIAIENKVDEIQNINPDYVLSFNYSDTYERKYGSQKNIKQ